MFQMNGPMLQLKDIIPMFILWVVLIVVSFFLVYKNNMKRKYSIGLYIVSIIIGGIILGAIPNAIMPIQQILFTISMGNPLIAVIPMIIVLIVLLASTLVAGRQFCGYACPLGALQELASKLQFKSKVNNKKGFSYTLNIPKKIRFSIRWISFFAITIISIVWLTNLLQLINPFLGFSFFLNPLGFTFWIPLTLFGIFFLASFFIYRPWCTLICPFGTLANITARFSRYKLHRTEVCTNCGLCEQICPTRVATRSDLKGECYLCNRCVDVCPVNALEFSN